MSSSCLCEPLCYDCTLLRVVDGDTLEVDIDVGFGLVLLRQRLRLWGVNCPEMRGESRPLGEAAKAWVEASLGGASGLRMRLHDKDNFGRWLAEVYWCGDGDGEWHSLERELLQAGHAVVYKKK